MKVICTQENLNKGLMIVNHVASKNSTLPILNNVLLEAKDGVLKLATTNLEIGINSIVRGRIEQEGSITITAKLLADYIHLLPNEQITLEVVDSVLHIQCEKHRTKINGVSSDEFPLIPQIEKKNHTVVNIVSFKKALSQVAFAAAHDDTRPEISGVFFNFDHQSLILAATDSYRLAEKKLGLDKPIESPQNAIVPVKTIGELLRSIDDQGESQNIEIILGDNQIKFSFSGTEIISRLIEGQYPDYRQIIPADFKTQCFVNVGQLSGLVKSASLFCRDGLNDIHLIFNAGDKELIVKSSNSQLGENISSIETEVNGDANDIIFNFRYLLDGLNVMGLEEVNIKLIDSQCPGLLTPKNDEEYRYIIMPIKQ